MVGGLRPTPWPSPPPIPPQVGRPLRGRRKTRSPNLHRPLASLFALALATALSAATYEVGPGQALTALGDVPWESLQPGDEVRIHARPEPYREKWVLCRQGTAEAPIVVRGVADANGALPVIDGRDATTRSALNYWNQPRGIVKIGGANVPPDTTPAHIVLENLDLRSGRPPYSFRAADGSTQNYPNNAASLYIEKGTNITLRGCVFHDSGNGLFISYATRDVLIQGCYLHDNGNTDSAYEHNSYTAAQGITFEFNRYGPLRSGCLGNNLKDRSAGLVVRYNWIEGGNRQLDLVDGEDSPVIQTHPLYRTTFVYGNVLIEPDGAGNRQIVHYGGDSGNEAIYRKGTLHFYHNTVVSTRTDRTTLFRLSTNDERCDARNNIFYVAADGDTLALVDASGQLALSHNWFKPGRRHTFGTLTGTITDDDTSVTASSPAFLSEATQDFRLTADSTCRDAGTNSAPAAANHPLLRHYRRHQQDEPRRQDPIPDLGAFEFSPYAAWRFQHFGTDFDTLAAADHHADPDGDLLPNLLEYAFLADPHIPSPEALPAATILTAEASPYLGIRFPRRPAPAELLYLVQMSADLNAWTDGSSYSDRTNVPATAVTLDTGSVDPAIIRMTAPLSDRPSAFLRVLVQRE